MSGTALRAWGPWLISLVAILAGMALIVTTPPARVPVGFRVEDGLSYLLMPLSSTTIGAIVAWRRPHNAVGWMLAALGWITSWQYLTVGYAIHGLFGETRLPLTEVSAWAFSWSGMWVGAVAGNLLVRFPDGRIAERRGWFAVVLLIVAAALATTALGFRQGPLFLFRDVANPFGLGGADGALDTAMGTAALLDVVAAVLGFNALFRRSGRAVGVERQQFKWFMAGVLLTFAVTAVGGALLLNDSDLAKFVISNGVAAVPISVGVAILRYRLYDIDLFIKRTVVYGGTSVAIALTFFLGVLALQAALRPLTAGSELAIAASTLGSLALLQPIRRRVQNAVDRRFDRARHDAAGTIEDFATQLRDEVDLDTLRTDLLGAVQQTMAPAHASLWLRPR
ncbi:MAG: hypothetical protein E6J13_02220 [Chloroflexi bacterium]|nr:MAG: hypothetical protein E6J13_02220 [Chloroflexota bacterium]